MTRILLILISLTMTGCIKIATQELEIYRVDQLASQKLDRMSHTEYWAAMQNLDFDFASRVPDSSARKQFASALEYMMQGNYEQATPLLEVLVDQRNDSLMVKHAATLLTGIYTLTFDWTALLNLDRRLDAGIDDLNTIALVSAWAKQEREIIDYPASPLKLPMTKSISGVPVITVHVNGVEQNFWVDTGAEFTVIASDIAAECGVVPLVDTSSKVGTSTEKKVDLWPGMISELKIRDLSFKNHPVFILNKEDLEFRILKIIKILKVDGIIGWNAIQNLKLEIDYAHDTLTISEPAPLACDDRNFHFLTQPFVSMSDTLGRKLHFFLDTGANKTGLYTPAFAYFDTSRAEITTAIVGGAGGSQKVSQLMLRDQSLLLGQTRIDFDRITGMEAIGDPDESFIKYEGILGSDIAQKGVLVLDFRNGWCEIIPRSL